MTLSIHPTSAQRLEIPRSRSRASPIAFTLLKVLDAKNGVRPLANARLVNKQLLAIGFLQGGTDFSILIDPATHLPAAVRTRDDDNIAGDSTYDLVLSDWRAV